MKKFLGILVLGLFLSNSSPAAEFNFNPTLWDEIVWFFEDLFSFESEKDAKIKQLEKRIKQLESKSDKSNEAQKIRDCLMADLEKLMCIGVD